MTKFKLLSAALIATALVATPAMARESKAAVRHQTVTTAVDDACTRAPAVGAFASQPWVNPPCEPSTVY